MADSTPSGYDSSSNIAFMMWATSSVALMCMGTGFLYSGLTRRKSALSILWIVVAAFAVVNIQWFVWGYSLAFSPASKFIGNLNHAGLHGVNGGPSYLAENIPDLVVVVYHSMIASLSGCLSIGAIADRGRLIPACIFIFCWATVVYDPIACWNWNSHGWGKRLGVYDFAGGNAVHITSGMTALAYSWMLGPRRILKKENEERYDSSHSNMLTVLGAIFLYIGWFGFNSGSALGANSRSVMACIVSQISGAFGGLAWSLVDFQLERKWSMVGLCSGIVAGLVGITPAAGFVEPWAALIIGTVTGFICNLSTNLKFFLRIDDAVDVFAIHGIGGFVGSILTSLFATKTIASLDGNTIIKGGWVNHHYVQLPIQLAVCAATAGYAFVVSLVLLFILNSIPRLNLSVSDEDEDMGLDESQIGEFAYDYIEPAENSTTITPGDDADNRQFELGFMGNTINPSPNNDEPSSGTPTYFGVPTPRINGHHPSRHNGGGTSSLLSSVRSTDSGFSIDASVQTINSNDNHHGHALMKASTQDRENNAANNNINNNSKNNLDNTDRI